MPIRPRPPREGGPTPPAPGGARGSRGITPPFGGLDPGAGQVAYALLTRPPLVRAPRGAPTARLACVRPAASVHPEPGSNSPLDMIVSLLLFFCPGGARASRPRARRALASPCPNERRAPGPTPPLPPPRPDPKANAKVARPRRTAKPRGENFPPGDRKGLVFSAKNFSRGAKISPRRGGLGAFRGDFPGEGRGGEARRAHGVRKSLRIAGGYAANPRGVQLRKKNARLPLLWGRRAFQWAIRVTCAQRPESPGLRRLWPHRTWRCK